jgi:hypothetical protein
MNSAESDKDVPGGHRNWNHQFRGRPVRLLNTSGGKAVEKNTVADKISEEFCKALPGGH